MTLNIIVTAKQVIDPDIPISAYTVDRENKRIVVDSAKNIPPVINGFDENGVEAALRVKEGVGDAKVTVLSAGASFAMDVMKKALSMGSDEMVLVQDDALGGISDSATTAKVLCAAIKKLGEFDLIICGRQASDWDNAQVPLGIAELLGIPCIAFARKVEVKDGHVICERILANGYEVITAPLPAVVTVSNELGAPRYPNLRNIMAAARKLPATWTLADLGMSQDDLISKLTILDLFVPEKESQCEIIEGEDEEDAGRKLALKLREDKVI
ncbi:electron transfer flavoprotein subunit beta/FixA family protein [Dehalococcoidia bacterium]|nr:electron transfer flavoprotein subunit beta/FixA family protein [Dehalococcoidia bacterium]